jgi:TonB family protein
MRAAFLAVSLIAALPAAAQDPAVASLFPSHAGRMFPVKSLDAWNQAQILLREAGIRVEESDKAGQFLVTDWVDLTERRFGFGPEAMPDRPRSARVQLHILVSPYVQPARVFVGSKSDLVGMRAPDGEFTGVERRFYNVPRVGHWFLDHLSSRLKVTGAAVPREHGARRDLARSLVTNPESEACLSGPIPVLPARGRGRTGPGAGAPGRGQPPAATPVTLREERPAFPGDQQRRGVSVTVILQSEVTEDGWVSPRRVVKSTAPDRTFDEAAMGAVSLWRVRPPLVDGCPVPTPMTTVTTFSIR